MAEVKGKVVSSILGGGVFWVFGGGSADFIFMGARIFSDKPLPLGTLIGATPVKTIPNLPADLSKHGQHDKSTPFGPCLRGAPLRYL